MVLEIPKLFHDAHESDYVRQMLYLAGLETVLDFPVRHTAHRGTRYTQPSADSRGKDIGKISKRSTWIKNRQDETGTTQLTIDGWYSG